MEREILKNIWNSRNPQHEINSDTGEDMFFDTVIMVFKDYTEALSQHGVSFSCLAWDLETIINN